MEITVVQGDVTEIETDVLVVNLFEGATAPGGSTGAVDSALFGLITQLISDGEITGEESESVLIHTPNSAYPDFKPSRVLVVGLGPEESFDLNGVRRVTASVIRKLRLSGARQAATVVHGANDANSAGSDGAGSGGGRLIDPAAGEDYRKYRGATCIPPNRVEAALATGRDDEDADEASLIGLGRKLIRDLALNTLVLTLDKQGLLMMRKGAKPRFVPTRAREVYDVTGAGDTVLAMLAGALANDAGWERAAELANVAAGLEVERFGAVPVDLDEILLDVLESNHGAHGKLRTLDELIPELAAHKRQGKTIAFTNGCFDILHAGHVSYLRAAACQGDLLVVALNSDKSIRKLKGKGRPVNHEADRVMVLSALESVDYVVVFSQDTPKTLLRKIKPDVLVKGDEYAHDQVVGHEIVESYGGKIALVPMVKGRSTTNIIRKIGSDRPGK